MAGYNAGRNYGMRALTAGGVAPLEARQGDKEATKGVVRNLLRGVNQMGDAKFSSPEQAQFMRQWGYHNVHQALVQAGYNAQDAASLMAEAMHLSPEKAGYGQGAGAPGTYGGPAMAYRGPEATNFRQGGGLPRGTEFPLLVTPPISGTINGAVGPEGPTARPPISGTINGAVDRPGPSPAALGPAGTRTMPPTPVDMFPGLGGNPSGPWPLLPIGPSMLPRG